MGKPRVLFVANLAKLHIQAFHVPYMEWFRAQGYGVDVAARGDLPLGASLPGCDRLFDIPFSGKPFSISNLRAYCQLRQHIREEEYRLIHCHTAVAAALCRLAARGSGAKLVYTAHGFHFYKGAPLRNWLYYPVERCLARYTDLLITINAEDEARAARFPARQRARLRGLGVDIARFSHSAEARTRMREALGLEADTCVFLSVGALSKRKNHAAAMEAMAGLKGDYCYLIAGEGPEEKRLLAQARTLGVPLRLLGYREDVAALLSAADVFVFPSRTEGLPMALMEAMAASLPVAATAVRGNVDLMENGQWKMENDGNAFTFNFQFSIFNLLQADPALRKRLGAQNRAVIEEYDLSKALAAMAALYESVLKENPGE